jgi:hypothetical protein
MTVPELPVELQGEREPRVWLHIQEAPAGAC